MPTSANTRDGASYSSGQPLTAGRIDVHSHLLPGLDDGCQDLSESLQCIRQLRAAGFVGSFCTPHIWPDCYPQTTPERVRVLTAKLQDDVRAAGLHYHLWPGGELRLFDAVIDWMQSHGVPTLGPSRCVLVDFWEDRWPRYAVPAFKWRIDQSYQPILGHPERLNCLDELEPRLGEIEQRGAWLQCNLRCLTGEDGYMVDRVMRQLLQENRYQMLVLDVQHPTCLKSRLDGMQFVVHEFGQDTLDRLTQDAPRCYLLDTGMLGAV